LAVLASELIDRTLSEWLQPSGDSKDQFDTLQTTIDETEVEIVLDGRAEFVPRDSILQIGTELILVKNSNGSVVEVADRGFGGTTPADHDAGELVWIDPTFSRVEILNGLRAIVAKMNGWGLYARAVDSTNAYTTRGVLNLPAGAREIHSIAVRRSTSEEDYSTLSQRGTDWVEFKHFTPPKFKIRRPVAAEGQEMFVVCIKDFTMPAAETDDLTEDCGLSEQIQEDLPMAVAGQVLKGREVPRVTLDRIREALSAAGLNPGVTMNIGDAMIRSFRSDAVMAERQRMNELDEPSFEWQRR
jgi:hypothetical protein